MKPTTPLLAAFVLAAAPALAQEAMDANGDGLVTFDEMLVAYPAMTEESFGAIDLNGDGTADAEELAVARESGLLPAG
jgi:hypothetical protein